MKGGGAHPLDVGSLWPGSNKGETGWHLPLSLSAYVVFVFVSSLSCLPFVFVLPLLRRLHKECV